MFKQGQSLLLFKRCKRNGIAWWQCPTFVFIFMGLGNIVAMLISYQLSKALARVDIIALIVSAVAVILLVLSYVVSSGFEKLLEVNEMKSEFINIVSHQLRSPLTSIKWSLDDLSSKVREGNEALNNEALDKLKEDNERMIVLLNELIVSARVQQGKLKMQSQIFSLTQLMREVVNSLRYFARASNIEIQEDYPLEDIKINGDAQYIKQALFNIVDNAVRYSFGRGKVLVELSLKNGMAVCVVEDKGAGIPIQDQKNVFKKFFRSKNILRYQTEGTGLGLFTARAIILMSGGAISFQSTENKGTKFFIKLPINKNN